MKKIRHNELRSVEALRETLRPGRDIKNNLTHKETADEEFLSTEIY